MPKPTLSVIIPTHLRSESLERALASFRDQTLGRDAFEIIVVSNFDDRRSKYQVDQATAHGLNAHFFFVGSVGVNRARNLGLERARGDVLFFMDDDCRLLRRDHLEVLAKRFDSEPEVALRGGLYRDPLKASSVVRDYNAIVNAWARGRSSAGPFVGGNFSVRASRLGARRFDDAITYGGSEVGFQMALIEGGERGRLDQDLEVEHDCAATRIQLLRKAWLQGKRKRPDPGASLGTSLKSLASSDVSTSENAKRVVFGVCYGGVSQLGWLSTRVSVRIGGGLLSRNI